MFRDPRTLSLTHLKLSRFTLGSEETKTTLCYMPVLADLTFFECFGVSLVVCALSGGTCETDPYQPEWCLHLSSIRRSQGSRFP